MFGELDKFTKCEALYLLCSMYHSGQWSEGYRLLCANPFCPGVGWTENGAFKELGPEGRDYFRMLYRKIGATL